MAGLTVGPLFGRPPVKGSCGGLACMKATRCQGCTAIKDHRV
nr:(Na+)-NQR maturation NqrM [Hoeflea halophila]